MKAMRATNRFPVLALIMLAIGCTGAHAQSPVVVSSKIDTEGSVLGQLIIQTLEANDIPTENRLQLGGTSIVREAIKAGEVDLYPEYTGNGAFFFDRADEPGWNDAQTAFETVRALDAERNDLVWLQPAPANNTWAMSVRRDLAESQGLTTLDDLADWLNEGGEFRFAASAEFVDSASALPAFQAAYGFELTADELLVLSGGDTAATMRAAAQSDNDVNGAMTYGTDGGISALGLVVLADNRGVQPVYQPAPIVREPVLEAYPSIEDHLAPLFSNLDLETLQTLNARVAVQGQPAREVAAGYLEQMNR
jgi:osmoprotectant transport system substrate-binding protein